jgi:DNA-binding transcriptional ArsR family regulator
MAEELDLPDSPDGKPVVEFIWIRPDLHVRLGKGYRHGRASESLRLMANHADDRSCVDGPCYRPLEVTDSELVALLEVKQMRTARRHLGTLEAAGLIHVWPPDLKDGRWRIILTYPDGYTPDPARGSQ